MKTKIKAPKENTVKIGTQYANKHSWGGQTVRGYVHYVTPTGEKISLPLGKNAKEATRES